MPDTFRATLKRLRTDAGLSLAALAKRASYSTSLVTHVENGRRRPTMDLATKLDTVLGANGSLADLAAFELAKDDSVERRAMTRILGILSALGVADVRLVAGIVHAGMAHTFGGAIDWHGIADDYGRAYMRTPPHVLRSKLIGDLLLLDQQLAQDAGSLPTVAVRLLTLNAMATASAGDPFDAVRWYRTARYVADETSNADLRLWVRGREAFRRGYDGAPPTEVLALVERVPESERHPCVGTVELWTAQAQALARQGEARAATQALEAAWRTHDLVDGGDPASIYSMATWRLAVAGSLVHALNGNAAHFDRASNAVAGRPTSTTRWAGQLDLTRALLMVRQGDIRPGVEHAATTLRRLAPEDRSSTLRQMGAEVATAVPQGWAGDMAELLALAR